MVASRCIAFSQNDANAVAHRALLGEGRHVHRVGLGSDDGVGRI